MLTPLGMDCERAAFTTIDGIEADIESILGADGHARLRDMLARLLTAER